MPSELVRRVRAKYPGAYDDLSDTELEAAVLRKYPEYQDLATPEPAQGSAIGRFVSNAADVLNPVAAIQGAIGAVVHPVKTYQGAVNAAADQFTRAAEAYGQGRYSEAAGHGLAGFLPGIGPAAAQAGEQMATGDIAGGLGRGLALAGTPYATAKAGRLVAAPMKSGARGLMQSALKPTRALERARAGAGFGSKKAITEAVLKEGRIVTPRSLQKAEDALEATDEAAHVALAGGAGAGVTVDPFAVTQAIDAQAKGLFGRQINAAPDVNAVRSVHEAFATNPHVSDPIGGLSPIPADLAHEFAMNTGRNLRGKFGRLGGATVEAEKAGREAITSQLREKIPALHEVWEREARQITARDALEQALARASNRDPVGLGGIVGAVKSPWLAAAGMLVRSPSMLSRGAQALWKGARAISPTWLERGARLALLARMGGLEPAEQPEAR